MAWRLCRTRHALRRIVPESHDLDSVLQDRLARQVRGLRVPWSWLEMLSDQEQGSHSNDEIEGWAQSDLLGKESIFWGLLSGGSECSSHGGPQFRVRPVSCTSSSVARRWKDNTQKFAHERVAFSQKGRAQRCDELMMFPIAPSSSGRLLSRYHKTERQIAGT